MSQGTGPRPHRDAELEAGDALRAWGVATVVLFHLFAGVLLLDTGTYDFQAGYGRVAGSLILGVQANIYMFFALSAFLLSRPYVRAALHPAARFPSTRRYVRHRIGRIIPAFWATVVVLLLAYGTQGSSLREVLALVGFAQVYDHGQVTLMLDHAWSVDVEVVFYLLLVPIGAASVWAVRRFRHGGALAVAAILAVAVAGAALEHQGLDPAIPVSQSPLGGLRSFLPGILLAVLAVRRPDPAFWQRLPRWTSAALVGVGLLLSWRMPHWAPEGDSLRLYLGTLAGGCILGAAVVRQYRGGELWRLLRGPVVAWIGERSYSIFLVHGIVFWALRDVGADQPTTVRRLIVMLLVVLPAIAAAAQALYLLVERPAMLYSRRRRPSDSGPLRVPANATAAVLAPVAASAVLAAGHAGPAAPVSAVADVTG